MKLTIDQALQQAVAAHKKEASRCWASIFSNLAVSPEHPDANHNLGLLAVSVNKADSALPLFRTALEANPKIEQFWLSYIDALIKADQLTDAQQVIEKAKNQGVGANKLSSFEETLLASSQRTNATSAHPSQRKLNSLLEHYQNGRYAEAEKLAVSITQEFPGDILSWEVLGALYRKEGRFSESLSAMQKTVELEPQNAEAHTNFGNMLQELGRLEEAEASLKQAIALKPELAEAHSNLGVTYLRMRSLDLAEASFLKALELNPQVPGLQTNLVELLTLYTPEGEASHPIVCAHQEITKIDLKETTSGIIPDDEIIHFSRIPEIIEKYNLDINTVLYSLSTQFNWSEL